MIHRTYTCFYGEQVGFVVDAGHRATETMRVVQLTPPFSATSITIGTGIVESAPGSLRGLQLVVSDIEAERVEQRVEVYPVRHIDDGVWVDGPGGPGNSCFFFEDPDGSTDRASESPVRSPIGAAPVPDRPD